MPWLRSAVLIWLFIASGARAEPPVREPARIALLIGNQKYADAVGALRNPHHDVALVADALRRLRFRVTVVRDGSHRQMDIAIKEHIAAVRRAGAGAISFFYYSGHGAADPETQINYVIPVDVASAANRSLWTRSIEQNDITDKLNRQAPAATHYVVFDACRNELKLPGEGRSLGAEKGFVPVPQTAGLLIAYSTAPKQTASDAGDDGGTYAKALAEEIVIPGQEAVGMFRNVQIRVKQAIGQDPWLSFPSLPKVYLAGQLGPGETSEAARAWEQVRASGSIQTLEALAAQFPGSVYAGLAKDRVAMLRKQKADEEKRAAEAALKEKAGLARLAGRWMIETRWATPCANPLGRLVVDIRADGTLQSFLPAVDTSAASDQRNDRVYDVNVGAYGSFRLGYRVEKSGERPLANILSGNLARGEGTGRSMRGWCADLLRHLQGRPYARLAGGRPDVRGAGSRHRDGQDELLASTAMSAPGCRACLVVQGVRAAGADRSPCSKRPLALRLAIVHKAALVATCGHYPRMRV